MHIPLVCEHLFYKYFVRQSVGQATKGKRASLLMDVVILVYKDFETQGNRIYSDSLRDRILKFIIKIPMVNSFLVKPSFSSSYALPIHYGSCHPYMNQKVTVGLHPRRIAPMKLKTFL